jgi:ribose transport system permease protein
MSTEPGTASDGRGVSGAIDRVRTLSAADFALQAGIIGIGLLLFIVFALVSSSFSSGDNLRNILMQVSVVGVVSIGETLVMLTGGIDLSVGSIVLFSSVVMSTLSVEHGWPPVLAILVGLAAGLGVGLLNGIIVVTFGIQPIIVTLGTLLVASGLGQILLQSQYVTVTSHAFTDVAVVKFVGIPLMVWAMLALYLLAGAVMYRTSFGRSVYAIGDNRTAARIAGLPVGRRLLAVYALSGLLAGVAGYLEVGQLGSHQPERRSWYAVHCDPGCTGRRLERPNWRRRARRANARGHGDRRNDLELSGARRRAGRVRAGCGRRLDSAGRAE